MLIFQILIVQGLKCQNLKDELNRSHIGGGVLYLLQSELSRSAGQYLEGDLPDRSAMSKKHLINDEQNCWEVKFEGGDLSITNEC